MTLRSSNRGTVIVLAVAAVGGVAAAAAAARSRECRVAVDPDWRRDAAPNGDAPRAAPAVA